ncbi:hypothetical protein VIGAN_03273500, partial [Vigna angularis var. angularis]
VLNTYTNLQYTIKHFKIFIYQDLKQHYQFKRMLTIHFQPLNNGLQTTFNKFTNLADRERRDNAELHVLGYAVR